MSHKLTLSWRIGLNQWRADEAFESLFGLKSIAGA